ncbi:hypothetical protein [Microbacterium murale]|uniref:Uncharacterized protein n=1 Tax=Microbacterium murale TaxID=1081040 RepID=A0ABU0PE44_9MICO|nr:hypothetical protein [Microbacterium murale]MDQ0645587.1 hypothetical protein [Microbacterium murale]
MNETDAVVDRASLVPGVHRLIRAIEGNEGPFTGTLVAFDDAVAVCVDVERLSEWAGWAFSDAEHVCGVLDIRRRADGHDALLPWCTQRVEAFLGRRGASQSPPTPGELGTLVASLLRGVRELGADADALGDWWLTADGRPLFVHGEGGSARARTAAIIERMVRQEADRSTVRILEEVVSALRGPRHPADDDRRWEEQLFARAAPRALQLDVFAPERVSDIAPRLVAADKASRDAASGRRRRGPGENRIDGVTRDDSRRRERRSTRSRRSRDEQAQRVDRSSRRRMSEDQTRRDRPATGAAALLRFLAGGARGGLERLRDRLVVRPVLQRDVGRAEKFKPSRRRAFLVAGALGAAVLIVGLLWPADGGDAPAEASSQKGPSTADSNGGSPHEQVPDVPASPTSSPAPSEPSPDVGTALDAVPALLDAIHACVTAAAESCGDAIAEGARTPTEGLAILGASGSTSTLVDDYGDVAVIRLTPIATGGTELQGTEQMMVLERGNDIWLVRDVYDVAHQPD